MGLSRASLLIGGTVSAGELATAFEQAVDAIEHDPGFFGIEVVSRAVHGSRGAASLSVTIDREGGVDIVSCERVAAAINRRLDAVDRPYRLQVESAGLNRPLTKPGDYERFSGRAARVITTLTVHGNKTHRGVLRGVRGTNVILETPSGELPLPLAAIKAANLEYDIRSDLRRDKKERKNA